MITTDCPVNDGRRFHGADERVGSACRLTSGIRKVTGSDLRVLVEHALVEDVGSGDVTTEATVASDAPL